MTDNDIKSRYAAVIVSYFPGENLQKLVKSMMLQTGIVVIVDNGSGVSAALQEIESQNYENVRIFRLHSNYGVAFALNIGIKRAILIKNPSFVITLDQDSEVSPDFVSSMNIFYNANKEYYRIGIMAPNFIDRNIMTQPKFVKITRYRIKFFSCPKCRFIDATFTISSGSIIPVSVLNEAGFFMEELFIDHVDTEFCIRLARLKYGLLINCGVEIGHSIGRRNFRKFLGLTFKPNNHSPLRRYYMFRNGVYLCFKYISCFPSFQLLILIRMIHEIGCIVLYEDRKLAKLGSIVKGLFDGFLGRLGKAS